MKNYFFHIILTIKDSMLWIFNESIEVASPVIIGGGPESFEDSIKRPF